MKEVAITGLCHPWQEFIVAGMATTFLLTGFFFLVDPKGMWQLFKDGINIFVIDVFKTWTRGPVITPIILDDNEGLEQRVMDNTWKLDEPKPAPIVPQTIPTCGYIHVNGQRMCADVVFQARLGYRPRNP